MRTYFDCRTDDLSVYRTVQEDSPRPPLAASCVRVKTGRFAFSSNNITYGAFGHAMKYWQLFPRDEGWGSIPVWGVGEVVESQHPDIAVGTTLYGVFPMGSEAELCLLDVGHGTFVETSAHRGDLELAYNRYSVIGAEQEAPSDVQLVFRPLFITAYLLQAHLDDLAYDDARAILITSASSKTAMCLAHYLKLYGADKVRRVGLTSARNAQMVRDSGLYDDVVIYEEMDGLWALGRAVIVDFAGNPKLVAALKEGLRGKMARVVTIGAANWQASEVSRNLPEEDADFFFAPTHVAKRLQDWGPQAFQEKTRQAWIDLLPFLQGTTQIKRFCGPEEIGQAYEGVLNNAVSPRDGFVLSFE